MSIIDCLKSKPNKAVIFKGTSYMFKRKHVHQGFAGFQALNTMVASCSLSLIPVGNSLGPDPRSKGCKECCNGAPLSRANDQE